MTRVPLYLEAAESVFVVFRPEQGGLDPVVAMTHDGKSFPPAPPPPPKVVVREGHLRRARRRPADPRREGRRAEPSGRRRNVFPGREMAAGGDPAFSVVKTLTVAVHRRRQAAQASGQDPETIELAPDAIANAKRPAALTAAADGSLLLEAWQNGRFELTTASGRKLAVHGPGPSARPDRGGSVASEVPGRLRLRRSSLRSTQLVAWNLRPDDAVKYFSGTATYAKVITIPAELLGKDRGLYLDLGRVAVMARVKLNGKDLGVLWKAPYRVEIGRFAKAGENTLEIEVTNLWINRMIGDENLPEDSDRNANGTLKAWPKWLLEGKSSPTGRQTFTSWRLYKKGDPLHESGLLGPVTLQATQHVVPR